MRHSEIIGETPYMHDGTHVDRGELATFKTISDSTLAREYNLLFTGTTSDGQRVEFHLLNTHKAVIGVSKLPTTPVNRNTIVFSLRFKHTSTLVNVPTDVDLSKLLQVDSVFIDPVLKGQGIASTIYVELIKRGFVVVSDNSQFEDGRQLWKKLAKESGNGYSVYVLDDETGYLTDETGTPIKYDATNIDDAKIWSSGIEFHGYHIILMAK